MSACNNHYTCTITVVRVYNMYVYAILSVNVIDELDSQEVFENVHPTIFRATSDRDREDDELCGIEGTC